MTHLFFLGNAPDLASAEINSVLSREKINGDVSRFGNVVFLSTDQELSEKFFESLGGTIKVATVFAQVENTNSGVIIEKITQELENTAQKNKLNKITFGISQYTTPSEKIDTSALSKKLKNEVNPEFKVRFVLPKFPATDLSSVVIKKQLVIDISIVITSDKTYCSRTIWVQDFEDWGKRDYGRPAVEGHIGMLPPKVARMMSNIALPTAINDQTTILDPFCGVGTIPAEALILGVNVIGADLDKSQVERTKNNLKWLIDAYHIPEGKYQTLQSDAPNVSKLLKQKIDAIVTEPDLGPNTLNLNSGQINELSSKLIGLYVACLKNWKEVLKPGGTVVMALPSFSSTGNISKDNNQYLVKTVIDKAKIMGYSVESEPFQYARPQAKVIRNICLFKTN